MSLKLKDNEYKQIQECLLIINQILIEAQEREKKKIEQNSSYYNNGFYYCGSDDESIEQEQEYYNYYSKEAFYNLVKKILINTTNKKGKIVYENYMVGYKKIECSSIFEIIDLNTNETIGEYHRNKNELILY